MITQYAGYLSRAVETFDPTSEEWTKIKPEDPCPLGGLHYGASAVSEQCLYVYGGQDRYYKRSGSLYELDTHSEKWTRLSKHGTDNCPRKKSGCGMVCFGKEKLVLFGGWCDSSGPIQPGANYTGWCTNELHLFDLKKGEWLANSF